MVQLLKNIFSKKSEEPNVEDTSSTWEETKIIKEFNNITLKELKEEINKIEGFRNDELSNKLITENRIFQNGIMVPVKDSTLIENVKVFDDGELQMKKNTTIWIVDERDRENKYKECKVTKCTNGSHWNSTHNRSYFSENKVHVKYK